MPEKAEGDISKTPEESRLKQMKDNGTQPEMPPVDAPYLIDYLWEVGPTMSGGMGAVEIDWPQLESWQRQMGVELQAWESRLLIRLSREYLSESHKATKRDYPSPYKRENNQFMRMSAARNMRESMRQIVALAK